jgi:hypothetical protein
MGMRLLIDFERAWALLSRWALFGPFLASPSFLSHFSGSVLFLGCKQFYVIDRLIISS